MKFDEGDRADESQVEDRRGMRFPGGGVGMGVGGLGVVGGIIYLVVQVLASNGSPTAAVVERLIEQSQQGVQMGPPVPPGQHQDLSGSCAGVNSTNDAAKFAVCVESNVQAFWRKQLAGSGEGYRPARLVLFTEATPSACGTASAETGPFYCPPDGRVYLDLGFFDELQRRFHARGGDFAEAYVIAHEYGHRVQDLVGTERQVRRAQEEHPEARGPLSVRMELQADCYAGVWGHAAYAAGKVSHDEIAEALDAAAAIGDDRIQKQALGRVNPETFTHGSSADRQKWFTTGLQTGDPAACDTFKASSAD
ncbi:MAG TPA: neutral zinc metallopeptidase [Polyangia bacterium]|nr:neutral zinc metallopeptidase [Polyangia bacterium]